MRVGDCVGAARTFAEVSDLEVDAYAILRSTYVTYSNRLPHHSSRQQSWRPAQAAKIRMYDRCVLEVDGVDFEQLAVQGSPILAWCCWRSWWLRRRGVPEVEPYEEGGTSHASRCRLSCEPHFVWALASCEHNYEMNT